MIRINLLPIREITAEFGRRQELTIASLALGLTLALILTVYVFQSLKLSSLKRELAQLDKDIQALNASVKGVSDMEQKVGELKGKLKVIEDLNSKKTGPVRVMESLTSATPARLWLTQFKETGGNLTLDGLAVDNQTIADFLRALSNSSSFQNVELVEATQVEQGGVSLKKFILRSNVIYELPPSPAPEKGSQPKGGSLSTEGKQG